MKGGPSGPPVDLSGLRILLEQVGESKGGAVAFGAVLGRHLPLGLQTCGEFVAEEVMQRRADRVV